MDDNIVDISDGFDRPQVNTIAEIFSNDLDDYKVANQQNMTEKSTQIENELFLSLKSHIDSQCKLNRLNQSRIRSFERFRKYCQRVTQFGQDATTAESFDLEQFRNEYNRFDQNYRHWRKRIRKLRKETKSSLSTRYQIVYGTLYELFAKIESFDQNKENLNETKNREDRYLSGDQIYPEISLNVIEQISSANLTRDNDIETTTQENIECNFHCFVDGCSEMFTTKNDYLDHLFEHSIDVGQNDTISSNTTSNSAKKDQPNEVVPTAARRTRSQSVKKQKPKKAAKNEKVVSKKKSSKKISIATEPSPASSKVKRPAKQSPKPKLKPIKPPPTKKMANETPASFKCDFEDCKFVGKDRWSLKTHQVIHSDLRPFKCDLCEKTFKYKGLLKTHQKGVHEGKRYECPFEGCQAKFSTGSRLRQHVEIGHTKDPTVYRCTVEGCKYSSLKAESLRKHSAMHSDDRPFKCMWPGCGKAFKLSNSRIDHILMHKNERGFKCKWPDCSYACNTYSNLLKHHAIHEKKNVSKSIDQNPDQLNLSDEQQQHQHQQPPQLQPQFEMMRMMENEANMTFNDVIDTNVKLNLI